MSLLDSELYFPDGQVYEEDYVLGSFMQSKMFQQGVVCSNCHNPHSGELKLSGNAVCSQCHQAADYDNPRHHHHAAGSAGSQCANCHMPETTYMQIDPRRDHSMQIPRPDLSDQLGTPNATANIVRASALQRLSAYPGPNALMAMKRNITNPDPLVRLGIIRGADNFPLPQRWTLLETLLNDKALSVRAEAGRALATAPQQLSPGPVQKQQLDSAIKDYISSQQYNADRGSTHTNLGNLYLQLGQTSKAKDAYLQAIRIEPGFANAYVNLADLYRQQNNDAAAQQLLNGVINKVLNPAALHYSLGLLYYRKNKPVEAGEQFMAAINAEPANSQYHFAIGLLYEQQRNYHAAVAALEKSYQLEPANPERLLALCQALLRTGNYSQAEKYIHELATRYPNATAVKELKAQLRLFAK